MKRFVVLISLALILCFLCSCKYNIVSDMKCEKGEDGSIQAIVYKGTRYTVWAQGSDCYSFYELTDEEFIGIYPIVWFWTFYEVQNPDFGVVLRTDLAGLEKSMFTSLPYYILPEGTELPDIKSVKLDKIILARDIGLGEDNFRTKSSFAEFESDSHFLILNNDEWSNGDEASFLGDILDFNNSLPIGYFYGLNGGFSSDKGENSRYDYYSRGYIAFTLKDYESFNCGPFAVFEYNGQLFVEIYSDYASEPLCYAPVREEYNDWLSQMLWEFDRNDT